MKLNMSVIQEKDEKFGRHELIFVKKVRWVESSEEQEASLHRHAIFGTFLGLFHFEGLSQYHSPWLKLPGDSIDAAERSIVLIDDVLEELNSAYPGPSVY